MFVVLLVLVHCGAFHCIAPAVALLVNCNASVFGVATGASLLRCIAPVAVVLQIHCNASVCGVVGTLQLLPSVASPLQC